MFAFFDLPFDFRPMVNFVFCLDIGICFRLGFDSARRQPFTTTLDAFVAANKYTKQTHYTLLVSLIVSVSFYTSKNRVTHVKLEPIKTGRNNFVYLFSLLA